MTAARHVGVVVLEWNGLADTVECLDSLHAATPRPAVVVVVDNGSREASAAGIRAWAARTGTVLEEIAGEAPLPPDSRAWLVLVRLPENRGFAGGNNVGLRLLHRRPELTHFLLLNNDATVAPDYFAALERALRAAPDAGLLSGTIYDHAERAKVWYAGGVSVARRALVLHREVRPASDAPAPTAFVTGCALVVSRPALEALGLLPECYFPAYVEDAEYSLRARAAGLRVLYAPEPTVYHKLGASAGRSDASPFVAYLLARHRPFYVRRNLRGLTRAAAIAYLLATKPARAATELLRGRPAMARAVLVGTLSGLLSPDARRETPPLARQERSTAKLPAGRSG